MTRPSDPMRSLGDDPRAAADLLRLLANERRLEVLCALREGELSVGELTKRVGLSQSALSQHLARLRADRAVATRREGQTIFYRIADDEVRTLLAALAEVMRRREGRGA